MFASEAAATNIVEPIAIQSFINGLRDPATKFFLKARNPPTCNRAISDALEWQATPGTKREEENMMALRCSWRGPIYYHYYRRGRGIGYRCNRSHFNRGRGGNRVTSNNSSSHRNINKSHLINLLNQREVTEEAKEVDIIIIRIMATDVQQTSLKMLKRTVDSPSTTKDKIVRNKQTSLIFFANFNAEKALRATISLFNTNLELILDSGASCCLLDKSYVPKDVIIDNTQTLEVSGVNGITSTLGFLDTFLWYHSINYPIRFYVLDKLPSHVVGLIGTHLFEGIRATIAFPKWKWSSTNRKLNILQLRLERKWLNLLKQILQTHVLYWMCYIKSNTTTCLYSKCYVQPSNGKIPVWMVNSKPYKLPHTHNLEVEEQIKKCLMTKWLTKLFLDRTAQFYLSQRRVLEIRRSGD